MNDAIVPELCFVWYASLDHAVSITWSCGPDSLLAKCDIQSTFCLLPVHPGDFCLLGSKFNGNWYVGKAIPMGCLVAYAAFEIFSTFLECLAKEHTGCPHITHYLDDFLLVGLQAHPPTLITWQHFRPLWLSWGFCWLWVRPKALLPV